MRLVEQSQIQVFQQIRDNGAGFDYADADRGGTGQRGDLLFHPAGLRMCFLSLQDGKGIV